MELTAFIERTTALIEQRLDAIVTENTDIIAILYSSARYSLLGGGKRIRPLLMIATTEMLGGDKDAALTPACALEMIHTYSLIHDDLPCMDDDDIRRNKPSLHIAYDEATAILAGDFLLTSAFEVLTTTPSLTPQQKTSLVATIAKRAGGDGMIGGQIADIIYEGKKVEIDVIETIHRKKTAAIISAAIECGAILAKASDDITKTLSEYGFAIGLAFQVIDDILDVTATTETLGKPAGSDVALNKNTYVTALGIDGAQKHAEELIASAQSLLDSLDCDSTLLQKLAGTFLSRSS